MWISFFSFQFGLTMWIFLVAAFLGRERTIGNNFEAADRIRCRMRPLRACARELHSRGISAMYHNHSCCFVWNCPPYQLWILVTRTGRCEGWSKYNAWGLGCSMINRQFSDLLWIFCTVDRIILMYIARIYGLVCGPATKKLSKVSVS